jgi:hypothetical protein
MPAGLFGEASCAPFRLSVHFLMDLTASYSAGRALSCDKCAARNNQIGNVQPIAAKLMMAKANWHVIANP